jgi:transglutaminase-like putative cysteine protease
MRRPESRYRLTRARGFAGLAALYFALCVFPAGPPLPRAADIEQGEDAVLLEERLEVEILSDTLARVRYFNRTKVLTGKGVEEHDVASIYYNPSISIREFRAAVVSPQGKRTEVKKQQFFDRAAFESFELYADSKNRSVSFPGLVPGSTLEYEYEQEVRNLFYVPKEFAFQGDIPARTQVFSVRAPVSFPMRFAVQGTPEYARDEKDGMVFHRWQMLDVPAIKSEYGMPPQKDVVPHVQIYLRSFLYGSDRVDATDWNGIARWTRNLSREKEVPGSEVAAKARELTAGLTEPMAKAQRIYEFVQKSIKYVAIEIGVGGLQPHDNASVFRNRYGDCKDKATLVIAMLQAVGVRAYPVLILTRDEGVTDRDYPSSDFNHMIAALPTDEGYLFMDPTWENAPFGELPWTDQGANALVVKEDGSGELVQTPLTPPESNRIEWLVTAAIGAEGDLEGSYTIQAWGQDKIDFAGFVADTKPTEREEALTRFMARICPGAVLLAQDFIPANGPKDSLKLTVRFKVPRFLVRAGSVDVLSLHLVRFPSVARLAASSGRRNPIFFQNLWRESSEVRLLLPAGRHIKKLPAGGNLEGPGIAATTSYEQKTDRDRDLLVVKRSITFSKREISASDYPRLKQTLTTVMEEESRAVTLQTSSS